MLLFLPVFCSTCFLWLMSESEIQTDSLCLNLIPTAMSRLIQLNRVFWIENLLWSVRLKNGPCIENKTLIEYRSIDNDISISC